MKSFFKEILGQVSPHPSVLTVLTVSMLLTISGPFGTYSGLTLAERALYWFTAVALFVVAMFVIKAIVDWWFPSLDYWRNGVLISAGLTALYTPIFWTVAHYMSGTEHELTSFWLVAALVFGVSMAVIQVRSYWYSENFGKVPRLFARLSNPDATRVKRMTGRDDYVDVTTDRGTETLLMRFSDAMAELEGVDGIRVHRSHWVADDAVRCLEKKNGRVLVVLDNDDRIPVSRDNRDLVLSRYS